MSSEQLAASVNTNAVVIRRVLGMLRKAGLVTSQAGVHGGARLAKPSQAITMQDVYRAVEEGEVFRMHCPNHGCSIGATIEHTLGTIYTEAQQAMEQILASKTLQDVSQDVRGHTHSITP